MRVNRRVSRSPHAEGSVQGLCSSVNSERPPTVFAQPIPHKPRKQTRGQQCPRGARWLRQRLWRDGPCAWAACGGCVLLPWCQRGREHPPCLRLVSSLLASRFVTSHSRWGPSQTGRQGAGGCCRSPGRGSALSPSHSAREGLCRAQPPRQRQPAACALSQFRPEKNCRIGTAIPHTCLLSSASCIPTAHRTQSLPTAGSPVPAAHCAAVCSAACPPVTGLPCSRWAQAPACAVLLLSPPGFPPGSTAQPPPPHQPPVSSLT